MTRIDVVAGVIYNADQSEILLALRPADKHQGDLWEFPGGKKEACESSETALVRELQEELGITARECQPFLNLDFDYPDKSVNLDIWLVLRFDGTPIGREQQTIRWVAVADINHYRFPAANSAIVEKLKLRFNQFAAAPVLNTVDVTR